MENNKFKNGIEEIKKISMTDFEKNRIFNNILNISKNQTKHVKSPWLVYTIVSLMKRNSFVYYVLIPLIIILSGGGVVFASQDSLPNDTLYPIKVKILEPVENALNFSPKEKAKHQSNLAKTRMIEAKILAEQGKLDINTEKKINKLLINHTIALDNAINKAKNNSKEEVDDIVINFRAEMNANASILEMIKKQKKEIEDNENKEEINEKNHLTETARLSADNIKDTLKKKKIENKINYKNKKEELKILIDNVDKSNEINKKGRSKLEEQINDNKHKKIDEAKKYLEEAEKIDEEGDQSEAHSLLIDSESLLKEAEILMNTEINFEDEFDEKDFEEEIED